VAQRDVTDGDASGGVADGLRARAEAFPWPIGLAAGFGAFVAGYLVVVGYMLVGIAPLQGTLVDRLVGVGFIFYNAHTVPIVSSDPTVISRIPNPVAGAAIPWAYYGIPVIALTAAAGLFTYWYRPPEQDGFVAVATGAAMTLGYLLLALVGTFAFTQFGALHPDRLWTLGAGLAYPLVCGTLGSIVAQSSLAGETEREEQSESGGEGGDG
jgi:hypothetical protein